MLPLNRGLSRALKTVRRTVFAPRYADAGPGLFSSPMVHLKAAASRKKGNKKTPCNLMQGVCGAPSGTRTQDPLIKSQLLSQMTQTKPILKSVQTSFIALSSLFHVKLDLLLFEFAFFKQPDTTPKSNTIH